MVIRREHGHLSVVVLQIRKHESGKKSQIYARQNGGIDARGENEQLEKISVPIHVA